MKRYPIYADRLTSAVNRALSCIIVLMLAISVSAAAEGDKPAARIRAAKHKDFIRIVLSADEATVKKLLPVLNSNRDIVIDFGKEIKNGGAALLQTDRGAVKEGVPTELLKSAYITVKGAECIITVSGLKDIKVSKLTAPNRVVIDAYVSAQAAEEASQLAVFKPMVDLISLRSMVIDAGHGGYDYGIRGAKFTEKEFALSIARDIAALLSKGQRDIALTRKSDLILTLAERIAAANKRQVDIFISFHVSSTRIPTVYYIPDLATDSATPISKVAMQKRRELSKAAAEAMARAIEKEFSINVIREELPLPLFTKVRSAAILIELPNPDEFNYEKKNRERMISALLKGLSGIARDERAAAPPAQPKPEVKPESRPAAKPEAKPQAKPAAAPEKGPEKI